MIMKKIYIALFVIISVAISAVGCGSNPSSRDAVEITIATLNDNIAKFAIDIRTGVIDTSTLKIIAGNLTDIKVPLDIEVNRENKLFVMSQGTNSIPPRVSIFSDTAEGNVRPEVSIDISAGDTLKAIGLAIANGTDFIYVSYYPVNAPVTPKIIRFSISTGTRVLFDISSSSIGDIELSGEKIFAVDPIGKQILMLRLNSSFEIQPGSVGIQGSRTGLQNPSSIALTSDTLVYVFDKPSGSSEGRIFVYRSDATGDIAPISVVWSYCQGKALIEPYGLAVAELLNSKIILACSENRLTTLQGNANGCDDFLQRISIGAPVAVTFDKVRF